MLIADEFNPPVAARRARSPHPHQPVRRCRRSGWTGPSDRGFNAAVDIDHWNADVLEPPDGRGTACETVADPVGRPAAGADPR